MGQQLQGLRTINTSRSCRNPRVHSLVSNCTHSTTRKLFQVFVQSYYWTPHDKYNISGIAHAGINRKDNIFMQRRLVQNFTFILECGQGTCSLTKHTRRSTALGIFPVVFPCMLPTPLCGIFDNGENVRSIVFPQGSRTRMRLNFRYSLIKAKEGEKPHN